MYKYSCILIVCRAVNSGSVLVCCRSQDSESDPPSLQIEHGKIIHSVSFTFSFILTSLLHFMCAVYVWYMVSSYSLTCCQFLVIHFYFPYNCFVCLVCCGNYLLTLHILLFSFLYNANCLFRSILHVSMHRVWRKLNTVALQQFVRYFSLCFKSFISFRSALTLLIVDMKVIWPVMLLLSIMWTYAAFGSGGNCRILYIHLICSVGMSFIQPWCVR